MFTCGSKRENAVHLGSDGVCGVIKVYDQCGISVSTKTLIEEVQFSTNDQTHFAPRATPHNILITSECVNMRYGLTGSKQSRLICSWRLLP